MKLFCHRLVWLRHLCNFFENHGFRVSFVGLSFEFFGSFLHSGFFLIRKTLNFIC